MDFHCKWSPPSRAAWIEIAKRGCNRAPYLSPPSRAAWIEITMMAWTDEDISGRRLHGRRGLKFAYSGGKDSDCIVAAFTGGVD